MASFKIKSADLLLLLLYSKGVGTEYNEPISGRTRLTKMIFVFEKECLRDFQKDKNIIDEGKLPQFFAWKFGPMSKEIFMDLELFIKIKFIVATENKNSLAFEEAEEYSTFMQESSLGAAEEQSYIESSYQLSPLAVSYVKEKILPHVSQNQIKILDELKKRFNNATISQILLYVYEKYPELTDKSLIKDKVLKN